MTFDILTLVTLKSIQMVSITRWYWFWSSENIHREPLLWLWCCLYSLQKSSIVPPNILLTLHIWLFIFDILQHSSPVFEVPSFWCIVEFQDRRKRISTFKMGSRFLLSSIFPSPLISSKLNNSPRVNWSQAISDPLHRVARAGGIRRRLEF